MEVSKEELLQLASEYKNAPGTVLLHSCGSHAESNRSFLCINPITCLTIADDPHKNPWDTLKNYLNFSKKPSSTPRWVGYFAYEMGAFGDLDKNLPYEKPSIPLAQFFEYEMVYSAPSSHATPKSFSTARGKNSNYIKQIQSIQEEIKTGQVYQVNLSHEIRWEFNNNPFDFFLELSHSSNAPFAAYFKSDDFSILSASPERLLKKKGNILETRPIKGTSPRGKTQEEDSILAQKLLSSEKDKAELLMITDLMRNDLGKVSSCVFVEKLIELEKYPNVFHLVSKIKSHAHPNISPHDIIRAVFPGGSITGCPKLSAMESIYRQEKRPRGIYTGSIGYFTENGDFDFNIAIRTLLHQNKILSMGLGGAVVSDSIPENEYNETLQKGAIAFNLLKDLKRCS